MLAVVSLGVYLLFIYCMFISFFFVCYYFYCLSLDDFVGLGLIVCVVTDFVSYLLGLLQFSCLCFDYLLLQSGFVYGFDIVVRLLLALYFRLGMLIG